MAHVGQELALGAIGLLRLHCHLVGAGRGFFEAEIGLTDFFLDLFALGDVTENSPYSGGTPLFITKKLTPDRYLDARAVLLLQHHFMVSDEPVSGEDRQEFFPVDGVDIDFRHMLSEQIFDLPSCQIV